MPWRGERRQGKQRERPESDKENSGTGEALEEGHPSGSSRKLKANRGNPWVYGFGLQTSGDSHYPGNTRPSFTVSDPNIVTMIIPRPLSRIEEDSKSHGTATSAGGGGGRHSRGFGSYSKQTGAVVAAAAAAAAPMASIHAVEAGEEVDGYSEGHPKQIPVALDSDDEYSDVNRSPPGSPQSGSGARAY